MDRLQKRQETIRREGNAAGRQLVVNTLASVIAELNATIQDLQAIDSGVTESKPDSPEANLRKRITDRIQQCIKSCGTTIGAFRPDFHGVPPLWWDSRPDSEYVLTRQIATRQTALVQISRRISEVQRMLAGPQVFDPEVSRIQAVSRNLRRAEERINDLNRRIAELEPCSVVVLGGMD